MVLHAVNCADVGQAQFVAHIIGHASSRRADQQVHQLKSFGTWWILDVDPARDLGGRLAHAALPMRGKGTSDWSYSWVPVVGPLIGGALAGVLAPVLLGLAKL